MEATCVSYLGTPTLTSFTITGSIFPTGCPAQYCCCAAQRAQRRLPSRAYLSCTRVEVQIHEKLQVRQCRVYFSGELRVSGFSDYWLDQTGMQEELFAARRDYAVIMSLFLLLFSPSSFHTSLVSTYHTCGVSLVPTRHTTELDQVLVGETSFTARLGWAMLLTKYCCNLIVSIVVSPKMVSDASFLLCVYCAKGQL